MKGIITDTISVQMLLNNMTGRVMRFKCSIMRCALEQNRFLQTESVVSNPEMCTSVEKRTKVLKIALVGPPNAGKSTLINSLVGRRVCSASSKVHTTRSNVKAITGYQQTQLIFLDTPGIVSGEEMRRHKLERSFISNPEKAILEADMIGVLHDVSNKHAMEKLATKTLRLLQLHSEKKSILIINKIDLLKSKQKLLNIVKTITNNSLRSPFHASNAINNKLSEFVVKDNLENLHGWSNFSEVFMTSALMKNGVSDIKEYLLMQANPGEWLFKRHQFTDEIPENIILQTVKSRLLEYLPKEIPYLLSPTMEYFEVKPDGRIVAVVLVNCPSVRIQNLVVGRRGNRIKMIAKDSEQDLKDTFLEEVFLKVVIATN